MPHPIDLYSRRTESYVRGRPAYPPDALEPLASIAGIRPPAHVADVGSGTGILTGALLRLGYRVSAVEPNAAMRDVATHAFRRHPRFESIAATAEHSSLPENSIDAITAGQSLHWFNPVQVQREFTRILRHGGALLAVWNDMQCSACAFCRSLDHALIDLLPSYAAAKAKEPDPVDLVAAVCSPGTPLYRSRVQHEQRLTQNGLWHRIVSASYAPQAGDAAAERLGDALTALYHEHCAEGSVTVHYVTTTVTAYPVAAEGAGR